MYLLTTFGLRLHASPMTGAYNEPIGGSLSPGQQEQFRFGDNAFGDGQLFWDFRNTDAQDYWAHQVSACLGRN